ncbi:hypothetical protein KZI27_00315 (plasmid) [Curtobacterium sp. TC1]|uniref:hypothetical protein n=1 Tax=Curtobacterium sp. TC1 TaxID=2862880 RepID=UPI001C9B050D|nr:hypothetical protein [Curtobacterium sp. TC1]QZQ53719.1 hypothetical protein KZI27_00315 [Curtobacterium sp. TC1]
MHELTYEDQALRLDGHDLRLSFDGEKGWVVAVDGERTGVLREVTAPSAQVRPRYIATRSSSNADPYEVEDWPEALRWLIV